MKLKKKLKSQTGETISETLVGVLISSMALVMLAAAITSSLSAITRSKNKLDDYYKANEAPDGVVRMSGSPSGTGTITITDESGTKIDDYTVDYFMNDEFSTTPVVAYKK